MVGVLPERPVVHLDAGYDYQPCQQVLAARGMVGQIATRGQPAPIQASRRWPVERTHAWANQYGKLRWCTERRRVVVEFWLALAAAAPGVAIAGTADPAAGHDRLSAQPLGGVASEEGEHGGLDAAAAAAAEQVFAVGVPADHQELPRRRVR
jgi:hypothetical protein